MMTLVKKFNIPAFLALVLGLGLMSGSFAQRNAVAARTDKVPAIQVAVQSALVGKYLHVIYAVGTPPVVDIGNFRQAPNVRKVRKESVSQLVNSPVMTFPAVEIEKTPGEPGYNLVIFVVSDSPSVNWVNPDVNPTPSQYHYIDTLLKTEIDLFVQNKGPDAVIQLAY